MFHGWKPFPVIFIVSIHPFSKRIERPVYIVDLIVFHLKKIFNIYVSDSAGINRNNLVLNLPST